MKGFSAGVVLAVLCLVPAVSAMDAAAQLFAGVSTELLRSRLLLDVRPHRLLVYGETAPDRPEYLHAGYENPWFALGPLEFGGLMKEIRNPLAYAAASSVFVEKTGMALDTSLSPSGRFGLRLGHSGRAFEAGLFSDAAGDQSLWAACNLHLEPVHLSLLAQRGEPERKNPSDEWFPDGQTYPGGSLDHWAARLRFGPGPLVVQVGCAMALPERLTPGWFVHALVGLYAGSVQAVLHLGAADEYLRPDGRLLNDDLHLAAHLSFRPRAILSARLKAEQTRRRCGEWRGGLEADIESWGGGLSCTVGLGWSAARDERIQPEVLRLRMGGSITLDRFRIEPEARLDLRTGDERMVLSGPPALGMELSGDFDIVKLRASLGCRPGVDESIEVSVDLDIRLPRGLGSANAELTSRGGSWRGGFGVSLRHSIRPGK